MELTYLEKLARNLLDENGLQKWTFGFNTRKRSLGICKYLGKTGYGRIEIQKKFAETASISDILDTLRHEVAHAVVGPGHGHGPVWKAAAIKLGATPKACAGPDVTGEKDLSGVKYKAQCPGCRNEFHKFRKMKQMTGRYCVKCGPEKGKLVFQSVRENYYVG